MRKKIKVKENIVEGSKVKINIDAIKRREDYGDLIPEYIKFIEENADSVFTVHMEREDVVSLVENQKWLFWIGDLIAQ